jgi:hypothetical protein
LGGRIEAGKKTRQLIRLDARQDHREVWPREGRKQPEARVSNPAHRTCAKHRIRREPSVELSLADFVECAEDREPVDGSAVQCEGAVRPLGVAAQLLNRVVAAAKERHVIAWGRLEADVGPQVVHVRTLAAARTG